MCKPSSPLDSSETMFAAAVFIVSYAGGRDAQNAHLIGVNGFIPRGREREFHNHRQATRRHSQKCAHSIRIQHGENAAARNACSPGFHPLSFVRVVLWDDLINDGRVCDRNAGIISQFLYNHLQDAIVDVLPALGTHAPMTDSEITKVS